jgi:glycosyltransferase involved in cell wall biosynthesis
MEGSLRGPDRDRGEITIEALAALQELEAAGTDPMLLAYYPVARLNPFQRLLYQRAWEAGLGPLPIVREERLAELVELARRGLPVTLHLHWLNMIFGRAPSRAEGRRARDTFLARIDRLLAAGGRLAWTVHNILPHDTATEAEDAALRAAVVERASAVHVMAPRTPELVRPWFEIPAAKVLHVPHPSYIGAYPDHVSRLEARHELGIAPDELVYVVLGSIRPYKGLSELLDAWEATGGAAPRRLVIAGAPSDEPGVTRAIERAAGMTSVLIHPRFVGDGEVQVFLRSADIAVLPYLRTLNSGVLMLAVTFGCPVIVPAQGGLADATDPSFARTFDPDRPDGLAEALRAGPELATPAARAAASAMAATHEPSVLSRRFADGLRELLASPEPATVR